MDNQKTKSKPTIRFDLPLSQPTDDRYNEFSYAKLFSDVVKKVGTVPVYVLLGRVGFCEMEGCFFAVVSLLRNASQLMYSCRNKNKILKRMGPTTRN